MNQTAPSGIASGEAGAFTSLRISSVVHERSMPPGRRRRQAPELPGRLRRRGFSSALAEPGELALGQLLVGLLPRHRPCSAGSGS